MQNEKIHKRGRYSAEFKEKVALEALTGAKTHAQIASEYGISPDLVKDWKKQAKEMLGECFRRGGRKTEMEKKGERIANLERLLAAVRTTRIDLTGRIGNSNDCIIIEAQVRVWSSTNFTLAPLRHSW